jgi:hypothetical protein
MLMHRISELLIVFVLLTSISPLEAADVTPAEARAIAKEAYIYGYPMADSYRINFAFFIYPDNPEYKGPQNKLISMARVFTPEDTTVQSPNSDTPYSFFGADLRTEPYVITVPKIEKERYYSIQLIDLYTQNFAYIGSRSTGNDAGNYLLAGPHWKGEKPAGINEIIRCETDLALGIYRTQLFNPADLDNVKKIQSEYQFQPLSKFLGQAVPNAAPELHYIKPYAPDKEKMSLQMFEVLNFLLQFCPTVPSEVELMERFAKIGIGAGKTFDANKFSPEIKQAIEQGVADAWKEYEEFKTTQVDTGKVTSGDMFGSRKFLKNNYLYRMTAAILGIYGNSKAEAMYPIYAVDSKEENLNGAHRYVIHMKPEELPPVHAFWSLTMYEMPQSLLVANPIHRYLINSPMLPELKRDSDGGLTIYIQHDSPGKEKESNWLPAPAGPFIMAMRLYWPKEDALDGKWKQPDLIQVK